MPGSASPRLWMAVLFVALLLGMPVLAPLFAWAFPAVEPPVFERGSFLSLWLSHAGTGRGREPRRDRARRWRWRFS